MTQTQSRDGFFPFCLTSLQLAQRPLTAARKRKGFETEKAHEPQTVWLLKHFSKISFVKASTRENKSHGFELRLIQTQKQYGHGN